MKARSGIKTSTDQRYDLPDSHREVHGWISSEELCVQGRTQDVDQGW
jgi:hypothetical protein